MCAKVTENGILMGKLFTPIMLRNVSKQKNEQSNLSALLRHIHTNRAMKLFV